MRPVYRFALSSVLVFVLGTSVGCPESVDHTTRFFEPVEFGRYEFDGAPRLEAPDRVHFGFVEPGERRERLVTVRNAGRLALALEGWEVSEPFELSFPEFLDGPPDTLAPGAEITALVGYVGGDGDAVEGRLTIRSDDPERSVHEVRLLANVTQSCLELEPSAVVDFGPVERGAVHGRTVRASNCSPESPTRFTLVALEGDPQFSLPAEGPGLGQEVTLEPGESVEFVVEFLAEEPGDYEGLLHIASDDALAPERTLALRAAGAPYRCPEAIIEATHPERTRVVARPTGQFGGVPLDRITLSAALSRDPDGGRIERVGWTLVERPEDTNVRLTHAPDRPHNELYLELAGRYVVELEVWNERGTRSCQPARLTIDAVADRDIHVQLVWDTPTDPVRDDGHGTDVDLHLLRVGPEGGARWNQPPWDCYWRNRNPDWGVRGVRDDDPSLDIDNVQGWGPENINLDRPEHGVGYRVGVHYFSDRNFGVSYATVRIFIGGRLVSEQRRKRMSDRQFWHVADIHWPGGRVDVVDALMATFP